MTNKAKYKRLKEYLERGERHVAPMSHLSVVTKSANKIFLVPSVARDKRDIPNPSWYAPEDDPDWPVPDRIEMYYQTRYVSTLVWSKPTRRMAIPLEMLLRPPKNLKSLAAWWRYIRCRFPINGMTGGDCDCVKDGAIVTLNCPKCKNQRKTPRAIIDWDQQFEEPQMEVGDVQPD